MGAAASHAKTAVDAATKDSKWNTFNELIQPGKGFREPGDRILIFTQCRVTQAWLAERLTQAGERVMQIHGGLNLDVLSRSEAVRLAPSALCALPSGTQSDQAGQPSLQSLFQLVN